MAPQSKKTETGSAGFTLIELLAVLGILAFLATMVSGGAYALRESGRRAKCASNLRSMATAAIAYAEDHKGQFPWALKTVPGYSSWAWDFVVPMGGEPEPGAMWDGYGVKSILQCPSFLGGRSNWKTDPYTGYNYNASYIGKVEGDAAVRQAPARLSQVREPERTALFGDGQYVSGANKFMRAPKPDRKNDYSGSGVRNGGTQGFRHGGKTNIAFCDGHVESLSESFTAGGKGFVSPGCGFISEDNSLYSLEK